VEQAFQSCVKGQQESGGFSPCGTAQKAKGALFSAPTNIARAFLFFFTLYIQNSILQWVIGTCFAKLYLPCLQQLAHFSIKIPS
jgi:hypothetical protein